MTRQGGLLGISRSGLYYRAKPTSEEDLTLMKLIDRQYLVTPFCGARKMAARLGSQGKRAGRKRVQRLMRLMGLRAVYRQPRTTVPAQGHRRHSHLLRDSSITAPNQVWTADITYIPMARGFMYLAAIMDWHSRYVLSWCLCNTLEAYFCVEALGEALGTGTPETFTTDQGSQFTRDGFTGKLEQHGIRISMDGNGTYSDNLFGERL